MILFDLQSYLCDLPLGELIDDHLLCRYGASTPALFVEQVEDVKVVRVAINEQGSVGVEIKLSSIEGIISGDRIVVVGRLTQVLAMQGVRIALVSCGDKDEELSYHEPHNNLYSLSCKLAGDASQKLKLSLVKTNVTWSYSEFFIDEILIVREIH